MPPRADPPERLPRLTRATLEAGVRALSWADTRLGRIVARYGTPPLWARQGGFRTLVRIVLEQQVSLRSAASLISRLEREVPGGLTVEGIGRSGTHGLRARGVTRQKAAYLTALAQAVTTQELDLSGLGRLPDDIARERLLRIRGIGPWSAGVYLLMALRRPDVWPPGDLALHVALARLRRQNRRPSSDEAERYARRWSPWRSVAARILWHGYLSERPARGAGGGG